jgi:hypothetical protein
MSNWADERNALRMKFTGGTIINATRKELEWNLVVLANSRWLPGCEKVKHEAETDAFSIVTRHLLQVRLGEELHKESHELSVKSHQISLESHRISVRSYRVAIVAAVIAALAAIFAGLLVLVDYKKSETTNVQTGAEMPALTPPTAMKELPESKLPPTNGVAIPLTSPAAVSQATLTNR